MPVHQKFISIDWGTTALRTRLISSADLSVIASVESDAGIAATYQQWSQANQPHQTRRTFYQDILLKQIDALQRACGYNLNDYPLVISGMASADIGMQQLPYASLPVTLSQLQLKAQWYSASSTFQHPYLLVSGIASSNDVMRGEEVQVAGLYAKRSSANELCILPGTHSKHVQIRDGSIIAFNTYMTGEVFSALCNHTVLTSSIQPCSVHDHGNLDAFTAGIKAALSQNALNAIFHVRTNQLFNKTTAHQNYHYLSGLVIGTELKDLHNTKTNISLIANDNLGFLYQHALQTVGAPAPQLHKVDECLISGHASLFKTFADKI